MDSWRNYLPAVLNAKHQTSDRGEDNSRGARGSFGPPRTLSPNHRAPSRNSFSQEDVFHTPSASPLQPTNSVSSNRMPSFSGIPTLRPGHYIPTTKTNPSTRASGEGPKPEAVLPTQTRVSYFPEEINTIERQAAPVFGRRSDNEEQSDDETATDIVSIYPTKTISRRYLHNPQPKEEATPWDEGLNFDLSDLMFPTAIQLPQVIQDHLQLAAQGYQSGTPPDRLPTQPFPSTSNQQQPATARVLHPSKGPSAPADNDADSGTEDEEYCCAVSRKASLEDPDVFYCYGCKMTYCPKCWKKQIPHKRGKPGHDKVDAVVAKMIQDTLEVDISEAEQAHLHLLDECASWFGAVKDEDGVVFRDFGRYASLMAEHSLEERKIMSPALISFVGDTGAGKSSLVKLLVGLQKTKHSQDSKTPSQTPVVGSSGAAVPTSGDVHLYADPHTYFTDRPLLYADCEGLRGGTLDPVGAKRRRKMALSSHARTRTASFDKYMRRRHETSERDIAWATTPERTTRKFFVEHLYPRLLYTFSDVIVFVVKNARTIEEVVEQLVVWADAVIETASNQPVLPHAIIVLNASDNQNADLWDVDASTTELLSSISLAVHENPRLKKLANKWISRGFDIDSVKSLLSAYYSSVRVVRIPEKSQPSLVHDQIQRLYEAISASAAGAQDEKHSKRVKLSAESLQPYLQAAFDHFCRDLNDPFDFIKASFADSGIPSDFSGNILKLAVNIMNKWQNKIDGALLFRELSFIVASCVMLDAVRNHNLGMAGPVFKQYIDHFDETLDDFCEKIWPCEYISAKGRCVNVKAGHTKGHQLSQGQVIGPGSYQSRFSAHNNRQQFRNDIFENLQELLSSLTGDNRAERDAAANLHESKILGPFYRHLGGATNFCARDFGVPRGQNAVEMKFCPLHRSETRDLRQMIMFKPEDAGVRVLTLDGGGVRGILMLKMLARLEQDLGGCFPIVSFFDLFIGTSTGGIIALGLVEMGWSVKSCLKRFEVFAQTAFQKHRMLGAEYLEWLVAGFQQGRYKVEPLEDLLKKEYTERNLFGGVRDDYSEFSPRNHIASKVGVTTTTTSGTPYLLANYNRHEADESARYGFLRSEKPEQEIKIYEAARATSAAPKIFKPYGHAESGHTFIDGGVYYNNPIEIALREQSLIWEQSRPRLPDLVLSLGTGHAPRDFRRGRPSRAPANGTSGPVSYYKHLLKIAVDHAKSSQRSEEEYHRVVQHYRNHPQAANCFARLNMLFEDGIPKPDNVGLMPSMMSFADDDLDARSSEVRHITNRMIASSFYFEPTPGSLRKILGTSITIQGHIRCRYTGNQLEAFGDLLKLRCQEAFNAPGGALHSPCFVLEDRSRPKEAAQVILSDHVIDGMSNRATFNLKQITLELKNLNAESDIYLRFGSERDSDQNNSISGFPRCWDDRKITPMTSRLNLSDVRGRFPSRRGRPDWSEPVGTRHAPILGRYAIERNPGLASDEQMAFVGSRLSEPVAAERPPQELDTGVVVASTTPYRAYPRIQRTPRVDEGSEVVPTPDTDNIHSFYAELEANTAIFELPSTTSS
ncbi:hypothetical protein B0A52_10015 [Exophiala mesophila]|uniref:PNPLA domain-containing protein n=1 Tax=Exophiala mesophila TaxID=212818 RepID=A0A438MS66_EXOME|nr:hypothetical protein B0A52_10015 [Exophiala mesophila]